MKAAASNVGTDGVPGSAAGDLRNEKEPIGWMQNQRRVALAHDVVVQDEHEPILNAPIIREDELGKSRKPLSDFPHKVGPHCRV